MSEVVRRIRVRNDSSANWSSVNPVLAVGEIGRDSTSKKFKIGDGVTAWNSLPFAAYTPAEVDALLADYATTADVNAAIAPVTSRSGLLASTNDYVRWDAEGGGEFRLSSDQVSSTDNVFRIERNDGTIVERIWDGINFYVEWVPLGVQVGTWGVTEANVNGDKLTAAVAIAPEGCTLQLKPNETYNLDFPMRILGDLSISGNWATIKRRDQRSSLLTANSNAGTSTVTVADASVFRVGMRAFVVKTSGVLGGHAMVDGTSVTSGSAGFIITNIVGNVVTLGGTLQQNCVIGNKLVALDQLMISDSATARVEIRDVVFDGNNSSHADVLDWAAGYGVAVGFATVKNCEFRNSPNESLTIGTGSVENCRAFDCFGSFFHASSAGDGSNANGTLIKNCYAKNVATKDGGHTEGVMTFSANSRNIRIQDCVFDNSAGTRGTGVLGVLDSASESDRDSNIVVENVVAKNYSTIITLSITTGVNFDRVIFKDCSFDTCGRMFITASLTGNIGKGPYIRQVTVENCELINCWCDFGRIQNLSWKNNIYRWDVGPGVYAGSSATFAGLPTTRIGGTALANGDIAYLWANDSTNLKGVYVRTSGAWVRSATISSRIPDDVYAGIKVSDCGLALFNGGIIDGPPFVANAIMANGLWLYVEQLRRTEAGLSSAAYMEVVVTDVTFHNWYGSITTRVDAWWAVAIGYDVANWTFGNVSIYTLRDNVFVGSTGMQVPAGAVATNCKVYFADTATASWATGIQLQGPTDATKTIGGAAINCYVPTCPGFSEAIRLGLTSNNAANKNCIAVGNVLAKAVSLNGTHDSVQSGNVVISLAGMTSPTVPPWRPVGANENLY